MRDLRDFFDPDLRLPINGKTYTITSPNAEHGLKLRALFSDDERVITDADELAEIAELLGATINDEGVPEGGLWAEMVADGLSWPEILHAGRTGLMYYGLSPLHGGTYWETGMAATAGNPLPPNPMESVPGDSQPKPHTPNRNRNKRKR